MKENGCEKDFSRDSKIKDSLLLDLLRYQRMREHEIPEEYEERIAAAGISREEQRPLKNERKRKTLKTFQDMKMPGKSFVIF